MRASTCAGAELSAIHTPVRDAQIAQTATGRIEGSKTAPNRRANVDRSLTKSPPISAKTREVSMAAPQDTSDLRPRIGSDDPRHGTTAGFHAGCHEPCCRAAINRYEKLTKHRQHVGIAWAIPALGVQRRIQALMSLGWTSTDIASECGLSNRNGVLRILHGQKGKPCRWVERKTYRRFAEAYERLCMTIPDHTPIRARTRAIAARKGYLPPLVWDDIDTDPEPRNVETSSGIDEVKVQRVLDGRPMRCTPAEQAEVVSRWTGSLSELSRLTGWNVHRIINREEAA